MRYDRAMNEQVLARIPMEHKRRLRTIAAERGISLSELIRQEVASLATPTGHARDVIPATKAGMSAQ